MLTQSLRLAPNAIKFKQSLRCLTLSPNSIPFLPRTQHRHLHFIKQANDLRQSKYGSRKSHYSTASPQDSSTPQKKSSIGINFHSTEDLEREHIQAIHNLSNSAKSEVNAEASNSTIHPNQDDNQSSSNSADNSTTPNSKNQTESKTSPHNENNDDAEEIEPENARYETPGQQYTQGLDSENEIPDTNSVEELMADPKLMETGIEYINQDPDDPDAATLQSDSENANDYYKTYYFDTFKIYTSLRFSGFTEGQSDVVTRAIRDMLSARLEECKEEGVPKSGMDNEAYLFEAACSELKTEVQKMRETQGAEYMSNLGRLQREAEIAQQELNEYMTTLKSTMDLDINDHKNATKEEEGLVHLEIQELHNKIAIEIISDLKSEIEALRWQTTRRGLAAVIFVAAAVLVGISNSKKEENSAKKEMAAAAEKLKSKNGDVEYAVPVLLPQAEDVSFDETISVPLLGEIVNNNNISSGSVNGANSESKRV